METAGLGAAGLDAIAARYPHRLGCDAPATCDVTIFSRTPLADTRILRLEGLNRRRLLTEATNIEGQPATIVVLHLTKPYSNNVDVFELRPARSVISATQSPDWKSAGRGNRRWKRE